MAYLSLDDLTLAELNALSLDSDGLHTLLLDVDPHSYRVEALTAYRSALKAACFTPMVASAAFASTKRLAAGR